MPKGRENVYTCRRCGKYLVTRDVDEGTTPFMMRCDPERTPGGCGAEMFSSGYPNGPRPPHIPAPTHEWYRPTREQLEAECRRQAFATTALREHVRLGGLLIRPIASDGSAPIADDAWRNYDRSMQTFRAAYDRWVADGKLGPPPPRPVRPHTPGWNPRLSEHK